jgi:hypothetical protein
MKAALFFYLLHVLAALRVSAAEAEHDVVVSGATAPGVIAAVRAAREGRKAARLGVKDIVLVNDEFVISAPRDDTARATYGYGAKRKLLSFDGAEDLRVIMVEIAIVVPSTAFPS